MLSYINECIVPLIHKDICQRNECSTLNTKQHEYFTVFIYNRWININILYCRQHRLWIGQTEWETEKEKKRMTQRRRKKKSNAAKRVVSDIKPRRRHNNIAW